MNIKLKLKTCILLVLAIGTCRGSDEDFDCNYYDSEDESISCSHSRFPEEPISTQYPGVQECCGSGQYKFHDNCEKRRFIGMDVCRSPQSQETTPFTGTTTDCPANEGCHRVTLSKSDIDNVTHALFRGSSLKGYCVYYSCGDDGWEIMADACVCQNEEASLFLDGELYNNSKKCCPGSNFGVRHGKKALICAETMGISTFEKHSFECKVELKSKIISKLKAKYENDLEIGPKNDDHDSCIVLTPTERSPGVQVTSFSCPLPCNGSKPCLRTCCEPTQQSSGSMCPRSEEPYSYISDPFLLHFNLTKQDIFKAPSEERRCPTNYSRYIISRPEKFCNDEVELFLQGNEFYLQTRFYADPLPSSEFCFDHTTDNNFQIEVCKKIEADKTATKLTFYPYFMFASCICLMATLAVYTFWPSLLTLYTRLMRHFSFSLMMSFILMSINQLVYLGKYYPSLCIFSGLFSHYFFLVAFTFLTMMSVEVKIQISGSMGTERRHRKEKLLGYLVPLVISLLTLIADSTLPLCDEFKPRFGERECYFSTKTSKFTFLYLPIGLSLIVNLFVFVRAIIALLALDREKRRFNLRSSADRNPKMEQFLIFVKLFFGMGFIWIFEIISAYLGDTDEAYWYFTDILNMLQGFYVFLVFVVKRNVYRVIFKPKTPKTATSQKERCVVSLPLMSLSAQDDGETTNVTDA